MSQIPAPVFPSPPQVYPQSNFAIQTTTLKVGVDKVGNPKTIPVNLVALQFLYLAYSTWSVAMTTQLAGRMDAIRGFFVDNTNCQNDVIIVNITFGFQIRVPARSSGFYPFLAPPGDLTFYLYNTGGTSATDSTNVYALDTTPDPANYPEYQRVLTYNATPSGMLIPTPANIDINGNPVSVYNGTELVTFNGEINTLPFGVPIINKNNWYIQNVYLTLYGSGTAGSASGVVFYDTSLSNTILTFPATAGSDTRFQGIFIISDFNYRSLGAGGLYVTFYGAETGATSYTLTVSIGTT